jgi:hypothetical protein
MMLIRVLKIKKIKNASAAQIECQGKKFWIPIDSDLPESFPLRMRLDPLTWKLPFNYRHKIGSVLLRENLLSEEEIIKWMAAGRLLVKDVSAVQGGFKGPIHFDRK